MQPLHSHKGYFNSFLAHVNTLKTSNELSLLLNLFEANWKEEKHKIRITYKYFVYLHWFKILSLNRKKERKFIRSTRSRNYFLNLHKSGHLQNFRDQFLNPWRLFANSGCHFLNSCDVSRNFSRHFLNCVGHSPCFYRHWPRKVVSVGRGRGQGRWSRCSGDSLFQI